MNTNYSKIALLLALGVAAGEVGAGPVEFYPKNVSNLKVQEDAVYKEFSRTANKMQTVSQATGDVVNAMNLYRGEDNDAESTFRGILLGKVTSQQEVRNTLKEVHAVRKSQLKALENTKKLLKGLKGDIVSLTRTGTDQFQTFFPGSTDKASQLSLIESLGSGMSKDIDDTVISGVSGLKFDSKYRCITPDEFMRSGISNARDELIAALRNTPGSLPFEKKNYDMTKAKEVIKNFAEITVAKLGIDTTKLSLIDNTNYQNIMNLNRKVFAFDGFLRKLGSKMKEKGLLKDMENLGLENTLFSINTMMNCSEVDLDSWIATADKLFDESAKRIKDIEKKKVEDLDGKSPEEQVRAIHLSTFKSIMSALNKNQGHKIELKGSGDDLKDLKEGSFYQIIENEFKKNELNGEDASDLYMELGKALAKAKTPSKKLNKINSVNNFFKGKSSSSYVQFDTSLDDADHNMISNHFRLVQTYIENNKESPSFPENARRYKEELGRIFARVEADYARDIQNLVGDSATSTSKMFKDMNREVINGVYAELKTSYDKVIQNLGDNAVPTVVAKKAAEAKTFADLEASDEFKAKNLKVTDISEDLKKVFAAEKDAVKANEMYVKIHTSLPVDPATKAQAEADVKALKALFAAEVQEALKLPANNLENALNLPAKPAEAEAEDAEPKKGKKNKRARGRGRGRGKAGAKGRKGRGRGSRSASKEKEGNARSESKGRRASKGRSASKGKVRGRAVARADAKEATAEA